MPVGTQLEVREASKTYGLPIPPYHKGCQDYSKILGDVAEFFALHPTHDRASPMIFGLRDNLPITFATLKWLSDKVGVEMLRFELRPLTFLFYQLTRVGSKVYEESEKLKSHLPVDPLWESLLPKVEVTRGVPWILNEGRPRARNFSSIMLSRQPGVETAIESTAAQLRNLSLKAEEEFAEEDTTVTISESVETNSNPDFIFEDSGSDYSDTETESVATTESGTTSRMQRTAGRNRERRMREAGTGAETSTGNGTTEASNGTGIIEASTSNGAEASTSNGAEASTSTGAEASTGTGAETSTTNNDDHIFVFERDAKIYLESLDLAFNHDIGCHHHMNNVHGIARCPLNIVTRYTWNILDAVIGFWKITPKEGMHCPLLDPILEREKRRAWLSFMWDKDGYTDLTGFDDSFYHVQQQLKKADDDADDSKKKKEKKKENADE